MAPWSRSSQDKDDSQVGRSRQSWWSKRSRRGKLFVIAIGVSIVALALALGLGLGLGLGKDDDQPQSKPTVLPLTPSNARVWQPAVNSTWQIILLNAIDLDSKATSVNPDVDIYDIDLFLNSKATIDNLHRLGKKVICYFSAGSFQPHTPDVSKFKSTDLGKGVEGWPGERWLNTNSDTIRQIMSKRMDLATQKGCDAVDPDNIDAYDNDNGLGLNQNDSINFMRFLANKAQSLHLAIGLKNGGAIIDYVLPSMQFAVNEQCVQYSDCQRTARFISSQKPVFHIEYPSEVPADFVPQFCSNSGPAEGSAGFSTLIKNYVLDGYVKYCDGTTATTRVMESN